jgi:hypothetical protein
MTFAPPARKLINKVTTVPAPIGGLNARDSLATMEPTDAIIMENLWPQPYGCSVRKGYRLQASGMSGAVNTIASWYSASGTSKLFAFSGSDMYDITTASVVGIPLVNDLTSDYMQYVSMSNTGGSHLILVNGQDDGILYNSSGVARIIAGDGIAANTWAGLDPKDAVQLTVHQGRLWAVKKNTATGWYLDVGAIQGTFTSFDFGPLFSRGGDLQYLTTWTLDDGNGAEDHLVGVSSQGEAVVYAGTDPDNDTTWAMVGVYYVGAPTSGRRGYTKIGGDLAILTQRGVVSMTAELVSTKAADNKVALKTDKIQLLISQAIGDNAALPGWQLFYCPAFNMLTINVPSTSVNGTTQLVANEVMSSEPWTRFRGVDAANWSLYGNDPYFSDYNGSVWRFWTGNLDQVGFATGPGTEVQLLTNPEFTTDVTSWSGTSGTTIAWQTGGFLRSTQLTAGTLNTFRQAVTGQLLNGVQLRLEAKYRKISGDPGDAVTCYVTDTLGVDLIDLPNNSSNTFVTNSVTFTCTEDDVLVMGTSGVPPEGATVYEFEYIRLFKITPGAAGSPGIDILTKCQQAYSYLGGLSIQKQVGMFRMNFIVEAPAIYKAMIHYDFETANITPPTGTPAGVVTDKWDASLWDVARWSGGTTLDRQWIQAQGIGVAASLAVALQTTDALIWVSTDYSYRVGTLL